MADSAGALRQKLEERQQKMGFEWKIPVWGLDKMGLPCPQTFPGHFPLVA